MAASTKHDRQEAIQKATCLFWEKGFHATSMRNLQQAIDMRPGSIYASFGSKDGLFKEAMQHYTDASLALFKSCAEQNPSPLDALKAITHMVVIESRESSPSIQCLLVKTVSELTEDNADLLAESRRLLGVMQDALAVIFSKAIECGELDGRRDPHRLARYLQVQLMGLQAFAQTSNNITQVNELIDDVFDCLR